MAAIQNLCQRVILLNCGEVIGDGKTEAVVERYLAETSKIVNILLTERKDRQGTGDIRFAAVKIKNEKGEEVDSCISGRYAKFILYFENKTGHDLKNFHIAVGIDDHFGNRVTVLSTEVTQEVFPVVPAHVNSVEIHVERLPLTQGKYGFTLYSTINGIIADWIQNAGFFIVESGDFYGTGKIPPTGQGSFLVNYRFSLTV
jgi:lipopolysaccharide transport system ATP-binding protein